MTTDPRERLRRIDPSPVDAEPPSGTIEATAVIHEIERRMDMEPRETPDQPTNTSSQQQQEAAPPPSAPDQVITAPQQRRRQGGRGPLVAIAAAVVVVVVIGVAAAILTLSGDGGDDVVAASPAASGPVTSFDDIAGRIYVVQGIGRVQYMYFLEDGTINVSTNPDLVVDRASDVYTTRFEGTQVLITSTSSRCPQPDQGGTWEIHLLENGNVQFLVIDEDPCALRSGFLQSGFAPVP
jgi:FlaG/FlaF family flagellin (archaellin)